MCRPTAILALAVTLLAGTSGAAPSWVNFGEGKRQGVAQGRPLFVFFDLGDENSEFFLKRKFTDPRVQSLVKKFVLVRVAQGSREVWKRFGLETGPAVMLCGSGGDLLEKGYWRSSEALHHAMMAALRKFGPVIAPAVKAEADALVAEIKTAMGKKRYGDACAAATRLAALTEENPYAERARITFARLATLAGHHLGKAAEFEKKERYYEALLRYETVVRTYAGIPAAATARKHLERYAKSSRIQRLVKEQKDDIDSRTALEKARARDAARPDLALDGWETLAARWPDTTAGREAAELARARRADPAAMARVREARAGAICPSRISIARSYIENGLGDRARAILESVVAEHPGTSYAKIAKEILAALK